MTALLRASRSTLFALTLLLLAGWMAAGCQSELSKDGSPVDVGDPHAGADVGAGNDGTDAGADGGAVPQVSCEGVSVVAGLAERCCPSFGVDACGPGLFCAAYDGRQFAACYVLHSRETGESCADDDECLSYRCNAETNRCAGLPNGDCNTDDGCGPGPSTESYVCVGGQCRRSSGEEGQPCGVPDDCVSGICFGDECVPGRAGDPCQSADHCTSQRCVQGACSTGSDGEVCDSNDDCNSDLCVAERCRQGAEGDYCTADTECRSGYCVFNACSPGDEGDECENASDCGSGLSCDNDCGTDDCQYMTTCTTGAEGSPCISQSGCDAGLTCSYSTSWPPGSLFGTPLGTCVGEESCGFLQQYCSKADEVCLRLSNDNEGICGPPGTNPPGSSCTEDADCDTGVCADFGDGVLLCSKEGGWGYPCWISNGSLYPGDEDESGCATNHRCDADLGEDGVGFARGTCGGVRYRVCSLVHDGTTIARYGGCADGGLGGCQPDAWGRKQCENDSSICESDSDCGGARCVVSLFCQ